MKEEEIYKLPCTHRFLVKYLIELIDKNIHKCPICKSLTPSVAIKYALNPVRLTVYRHDYSFLSDEGLPYAT